LTALGNEDPRTFKREEKEEEEETGEDETTRLIPLSPIRRWNNKPLRRTGVERIQGR